MFPVIEVDLQRAEADEPLGTKRKFWFTNDQGRRVLFKAEERGTGEDWAEKIACELAKLLGLPHVHYDLAKEIPSGKPGVICETIISPLQSLVPGNLLLLARDPCYPAGVGNKFKVRAHTVEAVAQVLANLAPPPATDDCSKLPDGVRTALDVFVGYVLLDAWIANQDRHHENWAAIQDGDQLFLAPTFDHGASLARNLTDEERQERLTTRDGNRQIPAFVRKARSAFYGSDADAKPLSTFAAWIAFAQRSPPAAAVWLEQLRIIKVEKLRALLEEVPPARLSEVGRKFTLALLHENQNRLLEESPHG